MFPLRVVRAGARLFLTTTKMKMAMATAHTVCTFVLSFLDIADPTTRRRDDCIEGLWRCQESQRHCCQSPALERFGIYV